MKISKKDISKLVIDILNEDKASNDITTNFFVDNKKFAKATIISKEELIICGIDFVIEIFKKNSPDVKIKFKIKDGTKVKKNKKVLVIEGNAKKILSAERSALNLLQHLSGISTLTEKYSRKTKRVKTILLDTRKTIPGLRNFEKYAAVMGGAKNHRFNLGEKYMIKDNHLNLTKEDVYNKILKMNKNTKKLVIIECDTLIQVKKALDCGVKHLLLDNMSLNNIKKAKKIIQNKAKIEVSGGVNINNIGKFLKLGIDYVSVGAITQSAPAVNLSMEIKEI